MIAVVEVELAEYRVPVFRRLQERSGETVVLFHGTAAPGSNLRTVSPGADIGLEHHRLPTRWLLGGKLLLANPLPVLRRRPRVAIIRHTVRNPLFFPTLGALRTGGTPVVGWGHGYSQRRAFAPERRFRDRAHLAVVRSCDAYVCYSEEIQRTLGRYVSPERVFVARNTLDTDRLIELRRRWEATGRETIRRDLGLAGRSCVTFIGRLHERKRPDVLLASCATIAARADRPMTVLVIGEGPMRPELEARAAELALDDVRFLGPVYGDEAARLLFASDVMAMPGALGLAAAHALALGVPVVTQRLGEGLVGHGPEAAYVVDGTTGRLAEAGGADLFASAVEDALARRDRFSREAVSYAERNLTLDGMVDGFVAAIDHVTA